ncbi:hypothetical protein F6X37_30680 [Paraburkholderia sp. 31.1]|uniref:hypothetical protein n=1 Tax=Paraburkholderia sp. 31.1 TaxID=2615205 RepID=UPI001655ACF9|nr:hypothetical protein [Paraburkholderia sp. 31.1]MBC8725758.1 hypothetical protein [Paraburkholderia sp. 31.1]
MTGDESDNRPHHDARAEQVLRMAAVAAVLFDPTAARALLDLPDAELGRLFKIRLMRVAGLSTALDLDVNSIHGQSQPASSETGRSSKRGRPTRYVLIAKGRLLHLSDFLAASGLSEQRLTKDLTAGRIFSVDIGTDTYFPAFFLVNELDRKALAKVVQRLGDLTGWAKWKYLTTPNMALGDSTPLQALMRGDAKQVLRSVAAFVEK